MKMICTTLGNTKQDRQCTYQRNIEARVQKKEVLCILSVCLWPYLSSIKIASVACLALQYFSTLSHKPHDLGNKIYSAQKFCFDFLYNFFV